jgi:TetR/AcrR family transcriptional repressor of nem operon
LKLPRPREFDEGVALEAAMQRFWAGGFAATSVRDIGNAMGLGQASIYNAFGDKRTLFTQCLDRYLDANAPSTQRRSHAFWSTPCTAQSCARG